MPRFGFYPFCPPLALSQLWPFKPCWLSKNVFHRITQQSKWCVRGVLILTNRFKYKSFVYQRCCFCLHHNSKLISENMPICCWLDLFLLKNSNTNKTPLISVTNRFYFILLLHNKSLPLVSWWWVFDVRQQQQKIIGFHQHKLLYKIQLG